MGRRDEFDTGQQPKLPGIYDMNNVEATNHLLDHHGFGPAWWNVDNLHDKSPANPVSMHEYIHSEGSDDDGRPAPVLHQHKGYPHTKWRRPDPEV